MKESSDAPNSVEKISENEVEQASALLGEIAFQNQLRTRSKFFVGPGEVYHDKKRGGTTGVADIQSEIDTARDLEQKFLEYRGIKVLEDLASLFQKKYL